jgi:UDP-N-acetylmuramoyl-L-alanyl-D-glutamate--2,6-diaminopimelate ligase
LTASNAIAEARDATLGALLEGASIQLPPPGEALGARVAGLDYHSKRVRPGWVFFAFAGAKADGARFAAEAVERGAVAVVSESPRPEGLDAPWVQVADLRRVLATAARRFHSDVAASIQVAGTTGTNGKTTTCSVLDAVLRTAGRTTVLVGTIGYEVAGEARAAVNTTPESLDLYRLFAEGAARGATHATMEVSSHGLALGRVWGMWFHTAIFTNLTQDHLDFHKTMDAYFRAKCLLFSGQGAPPPAFAVVNVDDEWGRRIPIDPATRAIRYGMSAAADLRAESVQAGFDGVSFDVRWEGGRWPVRSPLAGRFNVYNLLAAFGGGIAAGIAPEAIAEGIASRKRVAGRFERIDAGQPFLVVVDYAHTDDALRNVIGAARSLVSGKGRVITLFGCGGDRDREKRPLMGQAAAELSDLVVVTSDNPRGEDPLAIINDAMVGVRRRDTPHRVEPDRGRAIRAALSQARPGDVVLLAGKGHEDYQVLASGTIHFDDREEAAAALREFGFAGRSDR